MAKPNHPPQPAKPQTRRAGLPPPRTPRLRTRPGVTAPTPAKAGSEPQDKQVYEAQRRWFEREVSILRRLAQTERLAGDYVAAQRVERELNSFIEEASALMGAALTSLEMGST